MTGARLVVWFLFGLVFARVARADEAAPGRLVVVLRPGAWAGAPWSEGTQAVVAELVAGGYELTLRQSQARDRDELMAELEATATEPPVLGAVVVLREGDKGTAYVHTRKSGTVRVEAEVSERAVGEGALSLRITQLLGPPRLELPSPEPAPPAPSKAPPAPRPAPPPQAAPKSWLLALSAGLAFSSDLPEPLPVLGLSARRRWFGPLSLELALSLSPGASRLETRAGDVDVSAEQATLHLSFDPFRGDEVGLAIGLGGGIVWMQGSADPRAGFSGVHDATRVTLLSARMTAFLRRGDLSLLVGVEPGVMLPAVSISAGNEIARLGRPWTTTSVGLGWNF